jgi:Heparinase II/III-like protein/Heparinase II/III N-terminus
MNALRFLRTVWTLRPIQWIGRPVATITQPAAQLLLRRSGRSRAPRTRSSWRTAFPELLAHAAAEAARAERRLARLDQDPALRDYERAYGRNLLARGEVAATASSAALDPFPASVRARSVALAVRLGVEGLAAELALAARAVMLQLEWRLLGNHLLENGIALACAGTAAEGLEADAWWAVGSAIVDRELREQFLRDGGHFERSATYHGWLVAALLELVELRTASGLTVPDTWRQTLRAALDWIGRVRGPDDSWPLFNDASNDACPTPDAIVRLARSLGLVSAHSRHPASDLLADTGWAVLRAGPAFLVADVGPIGPDYLPGHAHADSLGFELWVGAARLCVDAGVAAYGQGPLREWTRSTAAHNTVTVDGADSSEVWASFRVGRRATTQVSICEASGGVARLRAEHDGYRWLSGRPVHERTWDLEDESLTIVDTIRGAGTHVVALACRLDAAAAARLGARVTHAGARTSTSRDVWYPNHAEPREALLVRGEVRSALPLQVSTRITWTLESAT